MVTTCWFSLHCRTDDCALCSQLAQLYSETLIFHVRTPFHISIFVSFLKALPGWSRPFQASQKQLMRSLSAVCDLYYVTSLLCVSFSRQKKIVPLSSESFRWKLWGVHRVLLWGWVDQTVGILWGKIYCVTMYLWLFLLWSLFLQVIFYRKFHGAETPLLSLCWGSHSGAWGQWTLGVV